MTNATRSAAARKAAATRAARKAAGYTGSTTCGTTHRRAVPKVGFAPQANHHAVLLDAMARLEEALVLSAKAKADAKGAASLPVELIEGFDKLQAMKARAMAPLDPYGNLSASQIESQGNERTTAVRMTLKKLTELIGLAL